MQQYADGSFRIHVFLPDELHQHAKTAIHLDGTATESHIQVEQPLDLASQVLRLGLKPFDPFTVCKPRQMITP